MRLAVALLVLLLAAPASAGEWYVHTVSAHVPTNHHLNEVNLGLAYRTDGNWRLGVYRNSYMRPSGYVAKVFELAPKWNLMAGAVNGYRVSSCGGTFGICQGDDKEILPLIALEWQLVDHLGVIFTPGLIHLELRY